MRTSKRHKSRERKARGRGIKPVHAARRQLYRKLSYVCRKYSQHDICTTRAWSSEPVASWRRHMFLCVLPAVQQLALAPFLGPYPQAYTASQLRSLRRAPADLITDRPDHIVTLLDPLLMNFRAQVYHHHSPCRAAVRTCSAAMELTYKAIRQPGIPPTVVISAPGLLVGSGMDTGLRGFLHAEPLAGAAHWSAQVFRVFRVRELAGKSSSASELHR